MRDPLGYGSLHRSFFDRLPHLEAAAEPIVAALDLMLDCFQGSGKLLVAGNGGSASDAEHIVGELNKSFSFHRDISKPVRDRLQDLYPDQADLFFDNLEGAIPAISLVSHLAFNTAFANDRSYEFAIAQHLYALGSSGDTFLAISTSGNSRNVVNAAMLARALDIKVIALTGASGGELAKYADVVVCSPRDQVHLIQEDHLPIYHHWCICLENELFGAKK